MKLHAIEIKSQFNPAFGHKPQVQWELSKHEIWKFFVEFSKAKAKLKREKLLRLEVKLTELEQNLNKSSNEAKEQYNAHRGEINEIYDEMNNNIKITSKCD